MKHEKIIKRDDKSKVLIDVRISTDLWTNDITRSIQIATKGYRCKDWIHTTDFDIVTEEEIHQAEMELWELLRPTR